jgi:hypothetical protein
MSGQRLRTRLQEKAAVPVPAARAERHGGRTVRRTVAGALLRLPAGSRGAGRNAALRQLANRLNRILHGCLKARTLYDETTAWPQQAAKPENAAA